MLTVTNTQLRILDADSYERYISSLVAVMQRPCFKTGLSNALTRFDMIDRPRDLATRLVGQAKDLGFVAVGDVTPFCLMAICDHPEFRSGTSIHWVNSIIGRVEIDPELRMDAIFSIIPASVRTLIFSS